jgi:hypothetical protein
MGELPAELENDLALITEDWIELTLEILSRSDGKVKPIVSRDEEIPFYTG